MVHLAINNHIDGPLTGLVLTFEVALHDLVLTSPEVC